MKRTLQVVMAFLGCAAVITSCKTHSVDEPQESDLSGQTFFDYCGEYAEEYRVIGEEDGKILVWISAPDFPALLEELYQTGDGEPIQAEDLKEIAELHPDWKREYEFLVEETDIGEIREGFADTLVKDLMVCAIQKINCTGEGGRD